MSRKWKRTAKDRNLMGSFIQSNIYKTFINKTKQSLSPTHSAGVIEFIRNRNKSCETELCDSKLCSATNGKCNRRYSSVHCGENVKGGRAAGESQSGSR